MHSCTSIVSTVMLINRLSWATTIVKIRLIVCFLLNLLRPPLLYIIPSHVEIYVHYLTNYQRVIKQYDHFKKRVSECVFSSIFPHFMRRYNHLYIAATTIKSIEFIVWPHYFVPFFDQNILVS